jgi:hypothetical protein
MPHKYGTDIAKLKKYTLQDSDQITAELIQAAGETLLSAFHKPINYILNKEELPDPWKKSIILIHKKGDKTDCNNYHEISLLSTTYKILSTILLSGLSPYIDVVIGDH